MKNTRYYNLFIFISNFIRSIIDVYSVLFLYNKGFSVRNIIYIYILIYFMGVFFSRYSLVIGNRIGYKYIFMFSSIATGISFYVLNNYSNVYLISLVLSLSIFTYHPIKHYYGIMLLDKNNKIGNSLIIIYLSSFLASFFVIKNISFIYLIMICIISIIPSIFINKNKYIKISYDRIPKDKIYFFIMDQTRILFLLLEPVYLYMISSSISYVGIFNLIMVVSSVIYMYFISRWKNISKYFMYINLLLVLVLLFKINIVNKNILLILAIFEGICLKTNEFISTSNLYDCKKNKLGYLIKSEIIFCLVRTIIFSIMYLFNISLINMLYILLEGIFILSFCYKKRETL